MSHLPSDELYQWHSMQDRWSILKYDYGTQQWMVKQWMPQGWTPTPASESSQERVDSNTSVASGHGEHGLGQPQLLTHQSPYPTMPRDSSGLPHISSLSQNRTQQLHRQDSAIHTSDRPYVTPGTPAQQYGAPGTFTQTNEAHGPSSKNYSNPQDAFIPPKSTLGTYEPLHSMYGSQSPAVYPAVAGSRSASRQSAPSYPSLYGSAPGPFASRSYHYPASPGGIEQAHSSTERPYEVLDPSYSIRNKSFFHVGKVFATIFSEPAGSSVPPNISSWNQSFCELRFQGHFVYTNVRRFVVVQQRKAFCYACPIFAYSGRATLKPGVVPQEHAVLYSWGQQPQLLSGESNRVMPEIPMVNTGAVPPLPATSRIYLGIHHPIQYNVKVKDVGYVPGTHVEFLIMNWRRVDRGLNVVYDEASTRPTALGYSESTDGGMESETENYTSDETESIKGSEEPRVDDIAHTLDGTSIRDECREDGLELVNNPRGFFKKGRVFMTRWAEPRGFSAIPFVEMARFVVIKSGLGFSVCLRMSTYSGHATTKLNATAHLHAAVIPAGGNTIPHPQGESLEKAPIEVKVEDAAITIDPMSRINVAKPYTVEHNIMVRNIGRVVGDSVGLLDMYFAESLGYTKP